MNHYPEVNNNDNKKEPKERKRETNKGINVRIYKNICKKVTND